MVYVKLLFDNEKTTENFLKNINPRDNLYLNTTDYSNWFVACVENGKEFVVKELLEKKYGGKIRIVVFSREVYFKKLGVYKKVLQPLFPGYIFVYKHMTVLYNYMKTHLKSIYFQPLCFKQCKERCSACFQQTSPCMVSPEEIRYILSIVDNKGLIPVSEAFLEGDDVVLTNGPLSKMKSRILWINRRKRKACVELNLFKRSIKLTVGLNINYV